jgi:ADP-ribose pyrophosphatase
MAERTPKVVFEGRVFRVERDEVTLPTGRTATIDAVRHRGSVVLVPQPSPGRVILIRQYRHVIGRWIWELPAGSLEAGEAPARAARRECQEEIGWRPTRLRRLGAYYPSPGFCDELMIFYRCTGLVKPVRALAADPDEDLEPRTFAIREVWRLVERGHVVDMKTVLGLVLLELGASSSVARAGTSRSRRGGRRSSIPKLA